MGDVSDRWREMLKRHETTLLLFAPQWSATPSDAEDALQNGFLKFWRTRERSRNELAYLYACVRGAAMDLGRGSIMRRQRVLLGERDIHKSPAEHLFTVLPSLS